MQRKFCAHDLAYLGIFPLLDTELEPDHGELLLLALQSLVEQLLVVIHLLDEWFVLMRKVEFDVQQNW